MAEFLQSDALGRTLLPASAIKYLARCRNRRAVAQLLDAIPPVLTSLFVVRDAETSTRGSVLGVVASAQLFGRAGDPSMICDQGRGQALPCSGAIGTCNY
jgi:hypothetical protein